MHFWALTNHSWQLCTPKQVYASTLTQSANWSVNIAQILRRTEISFYACDNPQYNHVYTRAIPVNPALLLIVLRRLF